MAGEQNTNGQNNNNNTGGTGGGSGSGGNQNAGGNSSGNDTSTGGRGNDTTASGSGNQTTAGGNNNNIINTGGGNDTTAGGNRGNDTTSGSGAGDWPADWRTKMAEGDKKLLGQLERYGSPLDLVKKIREQDALISSGSFKKPMPTDGTPEQMAAWRKENNIPDAPDKYDLKLPDGLVIGEDDKPIVDNMLKAMHGMNLNNDQVKAVLASYYENEKNYLNERADEMAQSKADNDQVLRQEWGGEYKTNVTHLNNYLATFSEKTRNVLQGAFDDKGMPLLSNADFIRDLLVQARTINPVTTVVGGSGGNQMNSVEDEIKGIEKDMADDRNAYFKDEKKQARYRELLAWKENQKQRA